LKHGNKEKDYTMNKDCDHDVWIELWPENGGGEECALCGVKREDSDDE
jgi:hypothetical protein